VLIGFGSALFVVGTLSAAMGTAKGGLFGQAMAVPVTGYGAVYAIEIVLLLATLVAVAPLLRAAGQDQSSRPKLA
jgi:BCD family chlorophyll transporter-like MFS transporter